MLKPSATPRSPARQARTTTLRLRRASVGACLLAGALLSAPAFAEEDAPPYPTCDRAPTEADTAAAKGAFQAGQAAFNEADYPRAINYWEDAYRRDCTAHKLLVNLARAYELNGQLKFAVRSLKTYNDRAPGNPEMAQNETRIARFEEKIARDEASAKPDPADPVVPPGGKVPDGPADPGGKVAPPSGEGKKPLLPLFVAGGGLVVGVIGAVIYFPAQSTISDFEAKCPNRTCPAGVDDSEANSARSSASLGGIVMGVGGAALVGGIVWYLLSPEEPATASRVTPTVGRGFGGLAWSGSF